MPGDPTELALFEAANKAGFVKDILTKSARHPHGIKVRLTDGQVGRVKKISSPKG